MLAFVKELQVIRLKGVARGEAVPSYGGSIFAPEGSFPFPELIEVEEVLGEAFLKRTSGLTNVSSGATSTSKPIDTGLHGARGGIF